MMDPQAKRPGVDLLRGAANADLVARASAREPHAPEHLGRDRQVEGHDVVEGDDGDAVHGRIMHAGHDRARPARATKSGHSGSGMASDPAGQKLAIFVVLAARAAAARVR
ncbi:hypothetical protein WME88_24840 [Sorangium sp. So ce216]